MPSSATPSARAVFVVPGRLDTRTGGYEYDRRIIAGLRALGWVVETIEIAGAFPFPSGDALDRLAGALASIAGGATVVVDGLAFGAAPEEVCHEAVRLRFVALVHHPLADETGLDRSAAAALEASERRALAAARLVVVTSRATAAALAAYGVGPDRIVVIEPGTDAAELAHASSDGVIRLLLVGSVVPRKGHLVLLDALARVPARNWHLTCVGSLDRDPAAADALERRVRELAFEDRVTLVDEADAVAIDAYYRASDVFVLPTFFEGYGMVVAEALARGLPVISTPTGGIADLVGDDAGLLVPPGDPAALAAALSRVLSSPAERSRLAAAARRARERLPRWDAAVEGFAAALRRVAVDG